MTSSDLANVVFSCGPDWRGPGLTSIPRRRSRADAEIADLCSAIAAARAVTGRTVSCKTLLAMRTVALLERSTGVRSRWQAVN